MHLTHEQEAIVSSSGDIRINAVAGSGKTAVLVEYAKRRCRSCRILYLTFNRSVRMHAQSRFRFEFISNVDVQTAHSLAHRRCAVPGGYRVTRGYTIHDMVTLLDITPQGRDPHSPYVIASHILKYASLFCNSIAAKISNLDYTGSLADTKAAAAARQYRDAIENGTRRFLSKMDRQEIDATHDFYLKKFQLSRPVLHYDILLFDEGQDASPVMLDVFLSQKATKVIVGDIHQQIYGWRHAVNALSHADFPQYVLSTSFRFNEHIARLAMECLSWKRLLGDPVPVVIYGRGACAKIRSRATIARTNLALLKKAVGIIENDRTVKRIYFEGNLSSYTYAAEGASIYDVLNLYQENHGRIRDRLVKSMKSFEALREYALASEDLELSMLIDIVSEYGGRIPALLKKLKALHVPDEKRHTADMVFSTLHRCKGMEYDAVTLADDFITPEQVKQQVQKEHKEPVDRGRLSEEINLAYVGVTRSRGFLDFPATMFPHEDRSLFLEKSTGGRLHRGLYKALLFGEKRKHHPNAYNPWNLVLDRELRELYRGGRTIKDLAHHFGRDVGAIRSRLRKQGLII
ncbi:MAG: UvrD-helicase domain-containing protein [Chitinispirillaceae bacterium]|nr:UvrD-helicase domain-containing protein [Chitinispirillaceae bacterium]